MFWMWERHRTGHLIVQHYVNTPVFIWFLHSASKHLRVTWSCRKFKVEPQYRYVPWKMSGIVYIIHIFGICCICYSKPQTDRNVFPWWNRWCFFPSFPDVQRFSFFRCICIHWFESVLLWPLTNLNADPSNRGCRYWLELPRSMRLGSLMSPQNLPWGGSIEKLYGWE